jgi:hypothetical protein
MAKPKAPLHSPFSGNQLSNVFPIPLYGVSMDAKRHHSHLFVCVWPLQGASAGKHINFNSVFAAVTNSPPSPN